jgi:hypothetical protein
MREGSVYRQVEAKHTDMGTYKMVKKTTEGKKD